VASAKILVVEDERIVAKDIQDTLKSQGYDVPAIALSGEEAIQKAAEIQPDLVLMDIVLKGNVDGIEAAEQIRDRFDIPVVYLTAYADKEIVERARITEPFGYIIKPFEERELRTNIEIALYKHKAEEALRETSQTLEAVFQASPLPIVALSRDRIVNMWNPAAERIFGWGAQEVIGRQYPAIPKDKMDEANVLFQRALKSGLTEVETRRQRKDASMIDVSISAAPLRDVRGNINGTMAVIADITERKKVENALKDSEARLRELFDQAPVGYHELDAKGRITRVNRTELNMLGYSAEDMVGREVWQFIIENKTSQQAVTDKISGAIPPGRAFERTYRCKDGATIPVLVEDYPLRDETGRIVGIRSTIQDITERKKAEQTLCEQKEILQTILDNIPVMIAFLDPNGVHKWVNQAWQKKLGWSLEEAQTQDVLQEFYTDPEYYQYVVDFIGKAESRWSDFRTRRRDGTVLDTTWTNVPLSDGSNIGIGLDITERKKAEEALRKSEQKYKDLFENAREAIITVDLDGRITNVNKLVEEYGFKREELFGKNHFEFIVEKYRAKAGKGFERLVHGDIVQGEMDVITPKGIVTVEYRDNPIVWAGEVIGVQIILTDITERKWAEQLLRKERDKAQKYLDVAAVMMVAIDAEQRVGLINKKGCEILGYSEDEILAKNWFDNFLPESVREEVRDIFEKTVRGEISPLEYYENPILTKSRQERLIAWHNTILRDEKGEVIGTLSSGEDITERKRTEEQLQRQKKELQVILDSVPASILYKDKENRFIRVNRICAELVGRPIEEIEGKSCFEIFPHDQAEAFWRDDKEVIAGHPKRNIIEPVETPKGTRLVQTDKIPYRDEKGNVIGVVGFAIDITERKKAEQALRESEQRFRTLFDQAAESVVLVDKETLALVDFNERAHQNLGFSREEFRKLTVPYLEVMESAENVKKHAEKVMRSGEDTFETKLRAKNGQIHDFLVKTRTVSLGGEDYSLSVWSDITDRKKAVQAIREAEEKYRTLTENSLTGVFIHQNGKYMFVNERFAQIHGYRPEKLLGKAYMALVHPDERDIAAQNLSARLVGKDVTQCYEMRRLKKDGQVIWCEMMASHIEYMGKPAIMGNITDITERKQAEEQIAKLAKFPAEDPHPVLRISAFGTVMYGNKASLPLLKAWRCRVGESLPDCWYRFALDALSSGQSEQTDIQCDGRTFTLTFAPVVDANYVNVYGLDVTQRKQAEQKLLDYQSQLKSLASQLTLAEERERRRIAVELHDRIGQSLAISKVKLDGQRHSISPTDKGEVLEDVCSLLGQAISDVRSLTFDLSSPILHELGLEAAVAAWIAEEIEQKYDITVELEVEKEPKPLDDDIGSLLFRDVRELLFNVVKHSQATKVKVSIRRIGERISISVEDNGMGFVPAEVTAKAVRNGGFGLFSIRERLEQLEGHLQIESAPGGGCKVTMIAPLKEIKIINGG